MPKPATYKLSGQSSEASPVTAWVTLDEEQTTAKVEIVFDEPEAITGVVRWDDGSPAAGCRITAWPEGGWSIYADTHEITKDSAYRWGCVMADTAEDGTFTIEPLGPGEAYMLVFQPDHAEKKACVREYEVVAGTDDLEVVLSEERLRGAYVFGRVSSALGLALEDVGVQVKWREEPSEEHWTHEAARWTSEIPRRMLGGPQPWQPIELDGDEFRMNYLVPGRQYVVFWTAAGHGTTVMGPFEASLDGLRQDVVLRAERTLEVQVLLPDGLPAAKAEVHAGFAGTVEPLRIRGNSYANDQGLVLIEDPLPGPYAVSASHKVGQGSETVEVLEGTPVTRVVVQLDATWWKQSESE